MMTTTTMATWWSGGMNTMALVAEFTTGGKINMVVSVGLVTVLFGWCVYRVLFGKPRTKHLHGMDIDTKDRE